MTTSTILSEEQMELVEPVEQHMFEREGFDRKNIRYELANVNEVDNGERYVKTGTKAFISPDSDRAVGPTSVGESAGSVELVETNGKQVELVRFAHSLTLYKEDREAGDLEDEYIRDLRNSVLELFDLEADAAFLAGITDADGSVIQKSALQWVKDNVPTDRTIDCSAVTPNVAADVVTSTAFEKVSGELVTDQFGQMLGKQPALARLNRHDSAGNATRTHWDYMEGAVGDKVTIPPKLAMPAPQGSADRIEETISDLGTDELILLPPSANRMFWRCYENPEPRKHDAIQQEGGREKHEYYWRYMHVFDPERRAENAKDAVHLINISSLF